MQRILFFILSIFFISTAYSQQKSTISGTLTDAKTGEPFFQARVYIDTLKLGVSANEYGFYSLTVPAGVYRVSFSYSGVKSVYKKIDLTKDQIVDLEFGADGKELDEIEINASKGENVNSTKIGQMELQMDEIKTLPAFMGEVDIIKSLQLLPGVSSVSEGGQGFYVRGGGPDQNLVLLDEAQVYNASHLFGFFSVFNSDAVKSVNMIKGGMPANFGGRISSVLEVRMNEGNNKKFGVKGGLGLIASRLTVEGPIVKDKGSFIFSARRTYIDVLMKPFIKKSSPFRGSGYYFYDLNFKANYRLGPKDRIFLSGYYGKDEFAFGNKQDDFSVKMPWGNGIVALRWNHIFSNKLFMNVTGTLTDYLFVFDSQVEEFKIKISSGIRDLGGKVDFSYFPSTRHRIKFGADYLFHTFTPASVGASQQGTEFDTGGIQKLLSHETAFYLQDEYDVNDKIRINAGLRYSMYQFTGPFKRYVKGQFSNQDSIIEYGKGDLIKFYHGLEPRISGRILLNKTSSIKAGYAYNYQYVHLTSLSAVSLPTDLWYPTTDIAKPQRGWQASIGYFKDFLDGKYETSVEIYYKGMKNLLEFKQGAMPTDNVNDNTDNLLISGIGWSYGAEFFIKKTKGKFTGWIGYTWAKSERKFPDLQEAAFPSKYDRRHDLSVVASYKLSERWTFAATFIYATGNTLTLPSSWYIQDQDIMYNYGARNSTRMAPYHRLDIAATWYDRPTKMKTDKVTGETIEIKKRFRSNVNFSVYNVYNRSNPYFLYMSNKGGLLTNDFKLSVKQVSLFPIIPSVTWNFEF